MSRILDRAGTDDLPQAVEVQLRAVEVSSVPTVVTRAPDHHVYVVNAALSGLLGGEAGRVGQGLQPWFSTPDAVADVVDAVARSGEPAVVEGRLMGGADRAPIAGTLVVTPVYADDRTACWGTQVQFVRARAGESAGANAAAHAEDPRHFVQDLQEANEQLILAALREQELAEQADRSASELKAVLDNMGDGVAVFDATGRLVLLNPSARALLGAAFNQAAGRPDLERLDLRRLEGVPVHVHELLDELVGGGRIRNDELLLFDDQGGRKHVMLNGSGVRGADGALQLLLLLFRDVTVARELEQLKQRYVSLISHDLRSPVAAVRLSVALLEQQANEPMRRKLLLGRIASSLGRMDHMLRDLLDVQRIDAGHGLSLHPEETDLAQVVRDVAEEVGAGEPHRVVVQGEESVVGMWSPLELHRALSNLANNALKYGDPGRPVTLTVTREGDRAAVVVHNEGPAIPAEDQARLFVPFARTERAASSKVAGWGLGLTLVRGCALAHGGRVRVRSEEGEGTRFILELPLRPPAARP